MGILDRFERRLDRLVNGAFARAFKAEVQPVEIASALQRECDDRAAIVGRDRTIVPNSFTVDLAPSDFERLDGLPRRACPESSPTWCASTPASRATRFVGPLTVDIKRDDDLETGLFRVLGEAAPGEIPVDHAPAPGLARRRRSAGTADPGRQHHRTRKRGRRPDHRPRGFTSPRHAPAATRPRASSTSARRTGRWSTTSGPSSPTCTTGRSSPSAALASSSGSREGDVRTHPHRPATRLPGAALDLRPHGGRRHAHRPLRADESAAAAPAKPARRPSAATAQAGQDRKQGRKGTARTLTVVEGSLAGTSVTLGTAPITIGRSPDCTVVIDDDYASNHHARISPHESGWIIEDLGSTNGTYVQRTRVTGAMTVPLGYADPDRQDRAWSCASERGRARRGADACATPPVPTSDCSATATRTAATPARTCSSSPTAWAVRLPARSPARSRWRRSPSLDEDEPSGDLLEVFADAVRRIEDQLGGLVDAEPRLRGMGTTLTAVVRAGGRLGLVHVGDSRGYLMRGGKLERITRDHTLVQSLIDAGRLTEHEAARPTRSATSSPGSSTAPIPPKPTCRSARSGRATESCSAATACPGSSPTDTIAASLLANDDPQDAVDELVDLALRAGGPDNITCVVGDVVDEETTPDAEADALVVGAVGVQRNSRRLRLPDTPAGRAAQLARSDDDDGVHRADAHAADSWHSLRLACCCWVSWSVPWSAGTPGRRGSTSSRPLPARPARWSRCSAAPPIPCSASTSPAWSRPRPSPSTSCPSSSRSRSTGAIVAQNLEDARDIVQRLADEAQRCAEQEPTGRLSGDAMSTATASPAAVSTQAPKQRRGTELALLVFAYAIALAAFAQVDLVLLDELSSDFTTFAIVFGLGLLVAHVSLRWLAPYADPILLPTVSLLNGLGLAMIHRLDLAEDLHAVRPRLRRPARLVRPGDRPVRRGAASSSVTTGCCSATRTPPCSSVCCSWCSRCSPSSEPRSTVPASGSSSTSAHGRSASSRPRSPRSS